MTKLGLLNQKDIHTLHHLFYFIYPEHFCPYIIYSLVSLSQDMVYTIILDSFNCAVLASGQKKNNNNKHLNSQLLLQCHLFHVESVNE